MSTATRLFYVNDVFANAKEKWMFIDSRKCRIKSSYCDTKMYSLIILISVTEFFVLFSRYFASILRRHRLGFSADSYLHSLDDKLLLGEPLQPGRFSVWIFSRGLPVLQGYTFHNSIKSFEAEAGVQRWAWSPKNKFSSEAEKLAM